MSRPTSQTTGEVPAQPREPFWSEAQKKLVKLAATITAIGVVSGLAVRGWEKWNDSTENRKRIERLEKMVPVQCKMCWHLIHSTVADEVCTGTDDDHPCWVSRPIESRE